MYVLQGRVEIDNAFAVLVIGADDTAYIYPLVCEPDAVEIVADDGGGDKFAKADDLAVVEVVVGGRL